MDIKLFCMKQRPIINITAQIIGIFQGFKDKKYLESVRIAIDAVEKLGGDNYYPSTIFNEETGWKPIFDKEEGRISDLFLPLLPKYLTQAIRLYYCTNIYVLQDNMRILSYTKSIWDGGGSVLLYDANTCNKEGVKHFLINELFKSLSSNYIQIYKEDKSIDIIPFELKSFPSEMSNELYNYISKSIDMKIPRAIMLCGSPGSGKSAISSTILKKLNLQTLIIKDFNKIGFETMTSIIKMLNVEALLIDDFDHSNINDNSLMLGFLEEIRQNVKVILATVNSTKKFHKALIRPGRFDKVILANKLDENVIKNLLGAELLEYFEKVKDWPIAYINEFVISMKLENKDQIDIIISDLQKRVSSNTFDLETCIDSKIEEDKTKDDAAKTAS